MHAKSLLHVKRDCFTNANFHKMLAIALEKISQVKRSQPNLFHISFPATFFLCAAKQKVNQKEQEYPSFRLCVL